MLLTTADCTPTLLCWQAGKEIFLRLEGLVFERMTQARCLCEAEKSMVLRVSYVKAVAVCDVPKEVASTAA
jgi:hypothetical protein